MDARWALDHSANFPPLVIHLSDGAHTDRDPADAFDRLGAVATEVGPLFLANVLVGDEFGEPVRHPAVPPAAAAAARAYRGATALSRQFQAALFCGDEFRHRRALLINSDPESLFHLLPTGSDPTLYAHRPITLPPHLQ